MGYTHYLYRPEKFDKDTFKLFVEDVKQIVDHVQTSGINLGDWKGSLENGPEINDDVVSFNGVDDESHETFRVEVDFEPQEWENPTDGLYFSFCKTARKPYDIAVATCLLALYYHFGDVVEIASDGGEEDWQPARNLYDELFDRKSTLNL